MTEYKMWEHHPQNGTNTPSWVQIVYVRTYCDKPLPRWRRLLQHLGRVKP
jgi:hypothetical protein